jgi:hypothetical protein
MQLEQAGESLHHVDSAADGSTRFAVDAPLSGRCERITSYLAHIPSAATLRRSMPWQSPPRSGPDLVLIAHHEAGHIVLMEWLGLTDGLTAEATPTAGLAHWPAGAFDALPAQTPDPTGVLVATAAAVYHAGLMAELMQAGTTWTGPIFYPAQTDYQRADEMLRGTFGRHASGAHAFAQRVALNVLASRWSRVQEIGSHLVNKGVWHSSPTPPTQQH